MLNTTSYILMRKLGPTKVAMLRRGQVRQVILMSSNLTAAEKAFLLREYGDRR